MMISLTDLLMTINTLFIVGLCIHYFKSHYTIMDMETYNQVCDICEEYTAMVQEKEDLGECEGGFFRECLEDEIDDEEIDPDEEDPDEEEDVHSEPKETPKKKRGRKAKTEDKKVASDRKVGF